MNPSRWMIFHIFFILRLFCSIYLFIIFGEKKDGGRRLRLAGTQIYQVRPGPGVGPAHVGVGQKI